MKQPDFLHIALTFDDGYLDHYNIAKLLAHLRIKATFFVITHLTRYQGRVLLASRPDKIREMFRMGHEIGSHSCTHPNLLNITPQKLEEELKDSKLFLESLLESDVPGFAYPWGIYSSRVAKIVKKYYSYARTTHNLGEDMWNVSCNDRYRINSFGTRHLMKLPLKLVQYSTSLKPVIMLHHEGPTRVLLLIRSFRFLYPKVKFITLKEMAEFID